MGGGEGAVGGVSGAEFQAGVAEPEEVDDNVEEEPEAEEAEGAAVAISDEEGGLVGPKEE